MLDFETEHPGEGFTKGIWIEHSLSDESTSIASDSEDRSVSVSCESEVVTKIAQKRKRDVSALYGGGPSSIAPLLYRLEFFDHSATRFIGDPTQSLLIRGRDPQKTIVSLFKVAEKYKTFQDLVNSTILYYKFLVQSAHTFNCSLEDAVETVYQEQTFDGKKLLHISGTSLFVTSTDQTVEGTCDGVSCKLRLIETSPKIFTLEKAKRQKIYIQGLDVTEATFTDLSKDHGDLHYTSLFFGDWEAEGESKGSCIDRCGFRYPDQESQGPDGLDSNVLLEQLNSDFNTYAEKVLGEVETLNPLQKQLKSLLSKFLNKTQPTTVLEEPKYVIVGAGRAAGEISRRLANDVLHSDSLTKICNTVGIQNSHSVTHFNNHSGRQVVVIDHRKDVTPSELFTSIAFKDFLAEITKFGILPTFTPEARAHYEALLSLAKSETVTKLLKSIIASLTKLLDSSVSRQPNFRLVLTNSFYECKWTEHERKEIGACEGKVWRMGGAKHQCVSESNGEYRLARMHDSHYRRENLKYLDALAKL